MFIICWKHKDKTGRGTKRYSKKEAEKVCTYLNSSSPNIDRWVELDTMELGEHNCKLPEILDQDLYDTFDCSTCGVVWQLRLPPYKGSAIWVFIGRQDGEG